MKNIITNMTFKGLYTSLLLLTQIHVNAATEDQKSIQSDHKSLAACDSISRFWVDAEYLYWKIQDAPEPVPLVVTGPVVLASGSPVLEESGTSIALGGESVDLGWRSGGKFSAGYRFGNSRTFGLEANYFFLANVAKSQRVESDGSVSSPFLSVPYINAETGNESSIIIANPGSYGGPVNLKLSNKMQGAEMNGLANVFCKQCCSIDIVGGFRYLNFNEDLTFSTNTPQQPPLQVDVYETRDQFDAKNNFYGGQIGIEAEYIYKRFFLNAKGKVALGAMCGKVDIDGSLLTNDYNGFGSAETFSGGYFALPTNIGNHSKTCFSVIPEANLNLGFRLFDCLRVRAGYMFMYVTNVFRAGKQIDRHINPSQATTIQFAANPPLVGVARPEALMSTSDLWVQGLNVGLDFGF